MPLSVSLWNDLANCIRWFGTGEFQELDRCFFIGLSCSIPTIVFYYFSLSLFPVYRLLLWGWGIRTDKVAIVRLGYSNWGIRTMGSHLGLPTFFNNNKKKLQRCHTEAIFMDNSFS